MDGQFLPDHLPSAGRSTEANVLLVLGFRWHRALMAPLLPLLVRWSRCRMVSAGAIAKGWRPAVNPDVIVICDAGLAGSMREAFRGTCIVHVGHGLISKNETAYHYSKPDYICVASKFIADRLTARGHVPRAGFLATGLIQTDRLFGDLALETRALRSSAKRTIAYAPTWNPTLSSAGMIGPDVVERLRGSNESVRILIKPHPHIAASNPEWISMWQSVASDAPNVELRDAGADLIPTLLDADLLVSDASSAIFHFLALDRPMVLIDNPARFSDPGSFDPDGIEWQWRDIGRRVEEVEELSVAVREELSDPAARGVNRRERRSQLFGELTDGRSTERVDAALRHIAGSWP